jgi:hypothetical protein
MCNYVYVYVYSLSLALSLDTKAFEAVSMPPELDPLVVRHALIVHLMVVLVQQSGAEADGGRDLGTSAM